MQSNTGSKDFIIESALKEMTAVNESIGKKALELSDIGRNLYALQRAKND